MSKSTVKEALGLGERLTLSNGAYIECVPACLADLDDAMTHWANSLGKGLTVAGCYHPMNKDAGTREALEELLYIACGRKMSKDELRKSINVADYSEEVMQFISRFLGIKPRTSGANPNAE